MPDQPAQHMQCMEVWGGSQLTSRCVEFGGLDAWVYSKPLASARGRRRLLCFQLRYRPHQPAAARRRGGARPNRRSHRRRSAHAHAAFRQPAGSNGIRAPAQPAVRRAAAHRRIRHGHRHHVLRTQPPADRLQRRASAAACCIAPPNASGIFWAVREAGSRSAPSNIPLGLFDAAEYEQFDIELEPGDCLLSFTDALIESRDADGEMLGEDGLLRILRVLGDVEPEKLIETLLGEIERRYPENLSEDDVTVLVVRANGRQLRFSLREKLRAVGRFTLALIRGERAPFPDANLRTSEAPSFPRWPGAGAAGR
jgi:hypothetical protein